MKRKIVHIITGVNQGGAENVLIQILNQTSQDFIVNVVSLKGKGYHSEQLERMDIPVWYFNFNRWYAVPFEFLKMSRLLRKINPDVIQTWMYHADLLGGISGRLFTNAKIFWNIRNGNTEKTLLSIPTWLTLKLCAFLSNMVPQRIITCSVMALNSHVKAGYTRRRFKLIPNGVDTARFTVDLALRVKERKKYQIDDAIILLGNISRWDPFKDHKTLLEAFKLVLTKNDRIKLLLAGHGIDTNNSELMRLIHQLELADKVILIGAVTQVEVVMNALDIFVLSSVGESFPNVVAEAMACGIPCVVTNAGDAGAIVGELCMPSPVGDPSALAKSILNYLNNPSIADQPELNKWRDRILENYSLQKMIEGYRSTWMDNRCNLTNE